MAKYAIIAANVIRTINLPDHCIVSLTLWDTPGKEDIDLTETYFNGLDAAVGKYMQLVIFEDRELLVIKMLP